ncbi:unnamed protein product, partial [Cuscuta europaea]
MDRSIDLASSVSVFVVILKSRHLIGPGEAGRGGKHDFSGIRVGDVDIREGDPDEELLGLDAGNAFHPPVFDEGGHLFVVPDALPDLLESVLLGLPLPQPHESGLQVPADLRDVAEGEEPRRHVDLAEELQDLLLANRRIGVYLGVLSVLLDEFHGRRRHVHRWFHE